MKKVFKFPLNLFILFSPSLWPNKKYFYWIFVRHVDDYGYMGSCLF